MKTLIMASIFAVGSMFITGCNTADNAVDCNAICDRYQTCFDKDYDSSACVDRCLDDSADQGYATKADACDACLDDETSCVAQTFSCASQCGSIVP